MRIKFNRCKLFGEVDGSGLKQVAVESEWSKIICSKILICESYSLMELYCVMATGWESVSMNKYQSFDLCLNRLPLTSTGGSMLAGRGIDLWLIKGNLHFQLWI